MNQGSDLDLRLEKLVITGACSSSREDRVVFIVSNQERAK